MGLPKVISIEEWLKRNPGIKQAEEESKKECHECYGEGWIECGGNMLSMLNKKIIRKIIETSNLLNAVFDAELCQSWGDIPEFTELYAALPDWLTDAIDAGQLDFDGDFDRDFWGSDSVVQFSIYAIKKGTQGLRDLSDRLDEWQEQNENEYSAFCDGMSKAVWAFIQVQENFTTFDAIVRGG